jgi:hypothetical protein
VESAVMEIAPPKLNADKPINVSQIMPIVFWIAIGIVLSIAAFLLELNIKRKEHNV